MSDPNQGQAPIDATPAASTQEQQPQAQAGLTLEQVKSLLEQSEARTFANLRKAGVFGKSDKETKAQSAAPPSEPTPSVDFRKQREFTRAVVGKAFNGDQMELLESAFERENPENVGEFVAKWERAFGLQQKDVSPVSKPTSSPNASPASNVGSPAGSQVVTDDVPLWKLSKADQEHLLQTKGQKWFADKYKRDLARVSGVKVRNY